jgi:peptide/nickel transport system substrate-binding protein/microcin C transport system substrate-binding protein
MKLALLVLSALLFLSPIHGHGAQKGSTFKFHLDSAPSSLNILRTSDYYLRVVYTHVHDTLGVIDLDTLEMKPRLATSWTQSKDGKTITVNLRSGVTWHDGKPFTAADVKFTFDAITEKNNKYGTAHLIPYYKDITNVSVSGSQVTFKLKKKYFGSLNHIMTMPILAKHIYEDTSKKNLKKLNKIMIGTGPYILSKLKGKKTYELKANEKWWGRTDPYFKDMFNYKRLLFKVIKDSSAKLLSLEKGLIDYARLTPEEYEKKTRGPRWQSKLDKVLYSNDQPTGYGFLGMNMKSPIFKSKKTRLAFAHLFNRKWMIDKYLYGHSEMGTGPLYRRSPYADPTMKPILFNPKKAASLLKEDGWSDMDGDRILEKRVDGKIIKFSFTVLEPSNDVVKYLTPIVQEGKKLGIDMKIKLIEWQSFLKKLDERSFDAIRLGWSGGDVQFIHWDPRQIWHTDSYKNQGSNYIGYSNKEVDRLIDQASGTLDQKKRIKVLRKVYRLIAEDVPYIFFFNAKNAFYAKSKKTKYKKKAYRYGLGENRWYISK